MHDPTRFFPLLPEEWQRVVPELPLSRREIDVVHCLLHGCDDHGIAEELHVSHSTVRSHMRRIFERLSVRDRTQVVVCVVARARALPPAHSPFLTRSKC